MRDKISIERVALLHPSIRTEVAATIDKIEAGFPANMMVRIVQGLRTFQEQAVLYAQGRTRTGAKVTNAKSGQSIHNYGLAFDFALMYDKDNNGSFETVSWDILLDFDRDGQKDWQEVVKPFKALGYTWGGDWKTIEDDPHLEKSFNMGWRDMLAKYNSRDFIPGTNYIKL